MESSRYWTRYQRLNRRRLLQGSAAAGIGTAGIALVGCGDDDDSSSKTPASTTTTGGSSPAASKSPSPAAVQPKKGGNLIYTLGGFPANLDPYATSSTPARSQWAGWVYSKLVQSKGVPVGPEFPSQEVVADLAQSWETPDKGLTYTMKLNPKAKWHAPLSRTLVADDIVFSYNRFMGKTKAAKAAINVAQLDMIDSVAAVDERTVTFKLKAPTSLFLLRLADDYVLPIMPPEVETTVDPTKTAVGTGAWIVDSVSTPTGYKLKRNPDWHLGPDRPYLDSVEFVVIADPATQVAQFKGRNVDIPGPLGLQDLPGIKAARPDVEFSLGPSGTSIPYIAFSSKDPNSPWNKDVRVRYALSMSIDRNSLFKAFFPANNFTDIGLPAPDIEWNNIVPVGLGKDWLDPKGDKIDASLKQYFEFAPDKAKALLQQAGYPNGVEGGFHYTTGYGSQFTQHGELVQQMVKAGGFNLETKLDDLTTVFLPKTFLQGDFDGMAQIYQGFGNAIEWLSALFTPGSTRNQGKINDATLTAMITKADQEVDATARASQIQSTLNYLSKQMYYVPGQLGAGPSVITRPSNVEGGNDHMTARSGQGFWFPYVWKS